MGWFLALQSLWRSFYSKTTERTGITEWLIEYARGAVKKQERLREI
jgi:hypothetical protein